MDTVQNEFYYKKWKNFENFHEIVKVFKLTYFTVHLFRYMMTGPVYSPKKLHFHTWQAVCK